MNSKIRYMTSAIAALLVVCGAPSMINAAALADRPLSVMMQGRVVDAQGYSYDGTADVEVRVYRAPTSLPADLIYAESFSGVSVNRGLIRLPIFRGTFVEGTPITAELLSTIGDLYVDMKCNGATILEHERLPVEFAAVRAEYAQYAEGVHDNFIIDPGDVPEHSALLITSDPVGVDRVPALSTSKVNSGVFGLNIIPLVVPAASISGGPFSSTVVPSQVHVTKITGVVNDAVIPDDVIRKDDIAFASGTAWNNGYIEVPEGFDRSQCKLVVSLREIDGFDGVDQYHIAWRPTGEVECRWSPREMGTDEGYCTINYLMVCKR